MTSSVRTSMLLLATPLVGLASVGCKLEPKVPEQRHELNASAIEANEDLAGDAQAQANLAGALDMLFGSPKEPSMMQTAEWVEDEYDPNGGGSMELSDVEWDALVADNEVHFASQLAAIREERFDDVAKPLYSDDLWASWEAHLALLEPDEQSGEAGMKPGDLMDPDDEESPSWLEDAEYIWTSHYPTLAETAEMYRTQCFHCHGVSGGGNGSTAEYLDPRPRDYRKGIFKFIAIDEKGRPRRQDLARVLREGIYTTSMPSFARFSEARIQGLVDYVRLLSRRGETEILLANDFEAGSTDVDTALSIDKAKETYLFVHDRWPTDDSKVIVYDGVVPTPTAESIERGKALFIGGEGKGANCASCHGVKGLGDGPSAKEVRDEAVGEEYVFDDWGNTIRPRNLTKGIFRFGDRPIDLYRRVYAGINGTPMPAHIGMQIELEDGSKREINESDIWDIVHYVLHLGAVEIEPDVTETLDAFRHDQAHEHGEEHGHGHGDHEGDGHDADHGSGEHTDNDGDDH